MYMLITDSYTIKENQTFLCGCNWYLSYRQLNFTLTTDLRLQLSQQVY